MFAAATVVGMLWLLALAVLGYLHIDEVVPLPELWNVPIPTLLLLGGIAAGVVFAFVFRLVNAASGRRRGRSAARSLRRQIEEVAEELVLGPVEAELENYAQLRKAIELADPDEPAPVPALGADVCGAGRPAPPRCERDVPCLARQPEKDQVADPEHLKRSGRWRRVPNQNDRPCPARSFDENASSWLARPRL